ncbi:hypothetical protein [Terrarubrum flagellatum]|uniref:hypothetical protein n=1 Tax=Terrirubrum flagellatum TaxID=2895980 RepID=UPI0031454DA4
MFIIAALDRFAQERDGYPDPHRSGNAELLTGYLGPAGPAFARGRFIMIGEGPTTWIYYRASGQARDYSLSYKLGWDPKLVYRREGGQGRWTVDPGDGGEERPLAGSP